MARSGKVKEFEKLHELSGKLSNQEEEKLMHSILENDQDTIDKGKLINESVNRGLGSFVPDMVFENLVSNYSMAKNLYGESILKQITGYSSDYLKKNVNIPEFKRHLKERIEKNVDKLTEGKILKDNEFTDYAYTVASVVLYVKELDHLVPQGIRGEKFGKEKRHYGDRDDLVNYDRSHRYKDISIRKTINTAIRRNHAEIDISDLRFQKRKNKGMIYVVYCIDSSGSMKGNKIDMAKKAGIALSFKATEEKDKVGLIVFGTSIKERMEPTRDFWRLLKVITKVRPGKETNITRTIEEATLLFPDENVTKHIILISDAIPNIGKEPEKETIEAAAIAGNRGITVSLIGIDLDKKGEDVAKKIVEAGQGKFFTCKEDENINRLVLEDYYAL